MPFSILCLNVQVDETVNPFIEPQLGQELPSGPGVTVSPQLLQTLVNDFLNFVLT